MGLGSGKGRFNARVLWSSSYAGNAVVFNRSSEECTEDRVVVVVLIGVVAVVVVVVAVVELV